MRSMPRRWACLALLALMLTAGAVVATAYPTSVVTLVVPYPAGTSTDAFAGFLQGCLKPNSARNFWSRTVPAPTE